MNKKGFTLTEMMAAVIIIGVIAATVAISFNNIMAKNKENKYKEFKREIEQAACIYIDLREYKPVKDACYSSGTCNVKVKALVESGLIDEDMINPNTDQKVNQNLNVQVKWGSDKVKKCTLQ